MPKLVFPQNEQTSEPVARIAARGLQDPKSLTLAEIRAVCASALAQRDDATSPDELARVNPSE